MKEEKEINSVSNQTTDLFDVLLDPNNCDSIMLINSTGNVLQFEQVAIIPHTVGKKKFLFAILKPMDKLQDIADDEAIVFRVDFDEVGNTVLVPENDEDIAIDVFDKYYDLLEEQNTKNGKGGNND